MLVLYSPMERKIIFTKVNTEENKEWLTQMANAFPSANLITWGDYNA